MPKHISHISDQTKIHLAEMRRAPDAVADGYAIGQFEVLTLRLVDEHGAECAVPDCSTCAYLASVLSVFVAREIVRAPSPAETEKRLGLHPKVRTAA